jgi:hypothetical protein
VNIGDTEEVRGGKSRKLLQEPSRHFALPLEVKPLAKDFIKKSRGYLPNFEIEKAVDSGGGA